MQIVGDFTLNSFKRKNESHQMIANDGIVRTPSDHLGIIVDFLL